MPLATEVVTLVRVRVDTALFRRVVVSDQTTVAPAVCAFGSYCCAGSVPDAVVCAPVPTTLIVSAAAPDAASAQAMAAMVNP